MFYQLVQHKMTYCLAWYVCVCWPGCGGNAFADTWSGTLLISMFVTLCVIAQADGSKIALSMKVVNQTTGTDLDPANVQTTCVIILLHLCHCFVS